MLCLTGRVGQIGIEVSIIETDRRADNKTQDYGEMQVGSESEERSEGSFYFSRLDTQTNTDCQRLADSQVQLNDSLFILFRDTVAKCDSNIA